MYVTEVRGSLGGWSQIDRNHLIFESATNHAKELVKKGYKPKNIRVVKVVAEFEPNLILRERG